MITQQMHLHVVGKGGILASTMAARDAAPDALLNHKYRIKGYPDYYFIVRKDAHTDLERCERVCLYRMGVIDEYRRGDQVPFDLWVSNELRYRRSLESLQADMRDKAELHEARGSVYNVKTGM
jgi:hypothetical protein